MRKHPEDGYSFAKNKFYLPLKSYIAILQHHERYDGTGYPHQKSGENISLYGRIVAIADVFDAISSDKPYRKALSPTQAYKTILESTGKAFDPNIVKLFLKRVSPYPVGYTLNLPDEKVGIVIRNYEDKPFNPTIKIIKEKDSYLKEPYLIEL